MGKRYERDSSEVMSISSVPSFRVKPEPPVKLVNTEPPYQRYTNSSSIGGSQRQDMDLDMDTASMFSDDEGRNV